MGMEGAKPGRRRFERVRVRIPARLLAPGGREARGRVENLGEGGAFFVTDDLETPLRDGEPITLVLGPGTPEERSVEGDVLRVDTEFAGTTLRRSLAVRFREPLPREALPRDPSAGGAAGP